MLEKVQINDLKSWLNEKNQQITKPVILDVREAWELETAKINLLPDWPFDFLHIPMGDIKENLHQLDKNRPIACLCHHGRRSLIIAEMLQQQGYLYLANIEGGIAAWSGVIDTTVARY
ncbi:MAG: rhodanese-like domain-containing protein [Gammaproteobacteria bacterium]|nr:rhodanese-like domain-containing protein [Gammaproteobacteria bacterium]